MLSPNNSEKSTIPNIPNIPMIPTVPLFKIKMNNPEATNSSKF
jgi:hypothetical protein